MTSVSQNTHVHRESNKKAQLTQGLRATAVRVYRHLGFLKFESCIISSAVPENPGLEPNMEWIGCTVCEIFAIIYCDLKTRVQGHWRSSKAALFDRAHTIFVFYRPSKYASICYRFRDIAAYWSKIASPLVFGAPLGMKPSDLFAQEALVTKN